MSKFWIAMHGGTTHFPIALAIASLLFDAMGYVFAHKPISRDLQAAGFYALLLGTLASFAAVISGLVISQWQTLGSGALAKHHLFLWPAFALMVGLAVWRLIVGQKASRRSVAIYLCFAAITAMAMASAGYWGGELLLGG